ncbi:MAG: radical SAM protein [Spirochaetia bacterium]|nr:radical SAM protein [Spirochaetia bacterium]
MLSVTQILRYALKNSDEIVKKDIPRFHKNMPPVIVWNITNECNMTCPHCYASAKLKKNNDELGTSEMYKIIDKLSDYGIKIIIFSGGEPLLRDDVFNIIEYAAKKNIHCHLSSNGVLISKEKAQNLKKSGINYVGVSIDGLSDFNDSYRGMSGAFLKALEGIKNAANAGLETGIRITLTDKNSAQLGDMLNLAIENNIHRFYLSHLVYGGRGKAFSKYDVQKIETKNLMNFIFEKSLEYIDNNIPLNIVTGGNDADGVYLYLYAKENFEESSANLIYDLLKKRGGNTAGEKLLNIDYKGNVHPDQFWQTSTCGNLLEKDLSEILENSLIESLRIRTKFLKGKCKNCDYVEICRGSHRERALAVYNDMWEEDPSCYI